jgi:hypothetical protein
MAVNARRALIFAAAALMAVAFVPDANASGRQVIRDCSEDGILNGKYTQGELQDALRELPSDLDEYTDCRAVIRAAQLAAARRAHGKPRGAKGAAAGPPTPDEQRKVDEAARSPGAIDVGGQRVLPGAAAEPLESSAFGTHLPPLVLAFLALLGALTLAGSAYAVSRNRAVVTHAGPLLTKLGETLRRGVARFRR